MKGLREKKDRGQKGKGVFGVSDSMDAWPIVSGV